MKPDPVVVSLLTLETCGDTVAQKSPGWISACSTSETSCGCEVHEHNNECRAIGLSCHMTMDLLCQEMRDACWESSEQFGPTSHGQEGSVTGSSVTAFTVPEKFSCGTVTATTPVSHRGPAVTRKEWDVVRDRKGEGT